MCNLPSTTHRQDAANFQNLAHVSVWVAAIEAYVVSKQRIEQTLSRRRLVHENAPSSRITLALILWKLWKSKQFRGRARTHQSVRFYLHYHMYPLLTHVQRVQHPQQRVKRTTRHIKPRNEGWDLLCRQSTTFFDPRTDAPTRLKVQG